MWLRVLVPPLPRPSTQPTVQDLRFQLVAVPGPLRRLLQRMNRGNHPIQRPSAFDDAGWDRRAHFRLDHLRPSHGDQKTRLPSLKPSPDATTSRSTRARTRKVELRRCHEDQPIPSSPASSSELVRYLDLAVRRTAARTHSRPALPGWTDPLRPHHRPSQDHVLQNSPPVTSKSMRVSEGSQ